ncbi:hypothetical protein [Desulfuromonas acetoxidans]|uniref:hypothetical protein n=1 Tax=Desulfuromonas acetoxidans TaxID=891 RepID=UPI00292E36F6|nr:hypothetical protein [Desulfuromonas acetoxidans]
MNNQVAVGNTITDSARAAFAADCLRRDVCLAWLAGQLHPAGGRCPECGAAVPDRQINRWRSFGRLECCECGRWFSAASGTWMAGAKLAPNQVFVLAVLLSMDVDVALIASAIGASEVTVRFWRDKFMTLQEVS